MKLLQLTVRVLCDVKCKNTADGVFLCSQTIDNQRSVFAAAKQLILDESARNLLIVESGPKDGYPGVDLWRNELLDLEIPQEVIHGVDLRSAASLNTLIEAEGMIAHAKIKRYKEIYIVASPFQQLRAYMTAVTVALRHYPDLRIYSYNGHSLSWMEEVAHSQGITKGLRKDLIAGELERIKLYQEKGDLASADAVTEYLDQRDRGHAIKPSEG